MIDKIKKLCVKYKEVIIYGIFGVLTTAVHYALYVLFTRGLSLDINLSNLFANILAIIFAYVTNRIFVFKSEAKDFKSVMAEMGKFALARGFSFLFDMGFVALFATVFTFNDLIVKLVSNVIVVILNYFLSKFIVFTKNRKTSKGENAKTEEPEEEKTDGEE